MSRSLENQLEEFSTVWWARGGHWQTTMGHLTNRVKSPDKARLCHIDLRDGNKLVAMEDRPPDTSNVEGVVLLMHGLGGDAEAKYMLSAARRFVQKGWVVFRLNHRGVGAGVGLSSKTYNSGLSCDLEDTLTAISKLYPKVPIVPVGYSMSGNILLKYLGEQQGAALNQIAGAIAVNPPADLGRCMARLELSSNKIYQMRFARLLRKQLAENAANVTLCLHPEKSRARTVRQFDREVTVPVWGFNSTDDYYDRASAIHHLEGISAPTLVLSSNDDPFVSAEQLSKMTWPESVTLHITHGGGHMGYLNGKLTQLGDRRWLDYVVITAAQYFVAAG